MVTATYHVGDVHEVLATLPENSVDLVLTSPPFLNLRSYLPDGHPDKDREIGGETTPGEFIDALLDVVDACDRVLAPHGSIAFELGDTYSGSGGAGGDYNAGGMRDGQQKWSGSAAKRAQLTGADNDIPSRSGRGDGWPLAKSLCLIPEMFRVALVYGFNPLTGRETDRWRARNVVRWCKPNPPVGALSDKYRPATSEMVVACKSDKRWFDLDAVRRPLTEPDREFAAKTEDHNPTHGDPSGRPFGQNLNGAPPLDWWPIPSQPYKGAHYATWPEALLVRPILSMCPSKVCTTCGTAPKRIVEVIQKTATGAVKDRQYAATGQAQRTIRGRYDDLVTTTGQPSFVREAHTVGWSDCGHDTWRPGVVLDPFAGSGTTLAVAFGHGRSSIGIDLDERNVDLARQRVGMWIDVIHHRIEQQLVEW